MCQRPLAEGHRNHSLAADWHGSADGGRQLMFWQSHQSTGGSKEHLGGGSLTWTTSFVLNAFLVFANRASIWRFMLSKLSSDDTDSFEPNSLTCIQQALTMLRRHPLVPRYHCMLSSADMLWDEEDCCKLRHSHTETAETSIQMYLSKSREICSIELALRQWTAVPGEQKTRITQQLCLPSTLQKELWSWTAGVEPHVCLVDVNICAFVPCQQSCEGDVFLQMHDCGAD